MRDPRYILKQRYDTSHALVIGINEYPSPLNYAVNDAKEIKDILINELGFESKNVIYLTDSKATRSNILKKFLSFTSEEVKVDDSLFVFFAGHGYTKIGIHGEIGYLVPYGADTDDLSSLIRWDELTNNAELIRAKHVLFVMDACYGGLAVNRGVHPGGRRFLKDMYQRFSRQVITAGKADEVVSDAGGPLPNHSVFTGHLIEGIQGKAADEQGIITANMLMSYVHTKVATDIDSDQTPHYGQFDGDGDFIISAPNIKELSEDEGKDIDKLISVPYPETTTDDATLEEKISYVKEILSSQKPQIKLHDLVTKEVKKFLSLTSEDIFAVTGTFSDEILLEETSSYERYTRDLQAIVTVVAYWVSESDLNVLSKIISGVSDHAGPTTWSNFRWYSLSLLLYHAGIAATESKNYSSLAKIFYTKCRGEGGEALFAQKVSDWIIDITRNEVFKRIPGHGRYYTPLSSHIFKHIQPLLDNLLFLGNSYEDAFDEFEILYALTVADLRERSNSDVWGPIGRFGWKYRKFNISNSPLAKLRSEADNLKEQWSPIKAGMFGGNYARFEEIANKFEREILLKLKWP